MVAPISILAGIVIVLWSWSTWTKERSDRVFPFIWGLFAFATLVVLSIYSATEGMYNDGQIDALKGIQTHEIHYVFPQGDTIPSDTLYLKID